MPPPTHLCQIVSARSPTCFFARRGNWYPLHIHRRAHRDDARRGCNTMRGLVFRLVLAVQVHASISGGLLSIVPTDGQVFTSNTTFVPGTYNLPNGVLIGASNITLDMNGATLVGTNFNNYGVTCVGYNNVVIRNGTVRNYYYGIRVESGTGD